MPDQSILGWILLALFTAAGIVFVCFMLMMTTVILEMICGIKELLLELTK